MAVVRMGRREALTITVKADDDWVVLNLEGYLSEDNGEFLRRSVATFLQENNQRVVLDLSYVNDLDMPGVRALMELLRTGVGMTDRLRLVGVRSRDRELLARTGVMRLVSVDRPVPFLEIAADG